MAAALQIPSGGLSLVGWPAEPYKYSSKESTIKRSAVLLKVNQQIIQDLQEYSKSGKTVRLLAGRAPRIQYGQKSIDLQVEPEKFTHELYTPATSEDSLEYTASVTQRASLARYSTAVQDTAGADAALANLKQSLASFAHNKEANQATISSSIIPSTKSNKLLPGRYIPNTPRSQASSPALGATKTGQAPTSMPTSDPASTEKLKAMSWVLSHLLAGHPLEDQKIYKVTRIPERERSEVLQKLAELDSDSKKWKLKDRSFKELDVWKFNYPAEKDRESAIDNAIRAYDRLRLGKDDKLWQLLLPEKERGKGKCLSRLHGNTNNHLTVNKDRKSPLGNSSPLAHTSDNEGKVNGRLTPKPGSTPMSRTASGPGKTMSIEKRLKESQKARAAEEAKEARRKEKEMKGTNATHGTAAARANKAPVVAKKELPSKIKSDAIVHSSDDESEGEIKEKPAEKPRKPVPPSTTRDARSPLSTSSSDGKPLKDSALVKDSRNTAFKPAASKQAVSPNTAVKRDSPQKTTASKVAATPPPSADAKATAEARKETPSGRVEKRAGNDNKTAAQKPQLSPRKTDTRPKNPSPLGRTTSSTSVPSIFGNHDKSPPVIVKKVTTTTAAKTARPAASIPSNARPEAGKKRPAPSDEPERPRKVTKTDGETPIRPTQTSAKPSIEKAKPAPKKTPATSISKPDNSDTPLKRKANDISSDIHDHDAYPTTKHRRTESSSTQSGTSTSSTASRTTTARTSVSSQSPPSHINLHHISQTTAVNGHGGYSPSTASSSSDPAKVGWERALDDAERFRTELYPKYTRQFNKVKALGEKASKGDLEKLWRMHSQCKQVKEFIRRAVEEDA
ncbi:RNA polymerase II elongation factor ell1 [Elsinoe australis]|uniref:RNA polymerase II elongation factor ell1 n=1 Tax=Elsinoe australis TaxID=40998 RepID=A0A2P7ZUA1_9PEZI|nr:RNA polymerase II elongation factor ell1 [Elsinoe australis]